MNYSDFRLGQPMNLTGEVRTVTMLDGDDEMLPDGVVDVTMRVVLSKQTSADLLHGDCRCVTCGFIHASSDVRRES